jgi:hypothetical protein
MTMNHKAFIDVVGEPGNLTPNYGIDKVLLLQEYYNMNLHCLRIARAAYCCVRRINTEFRPEVNYLNTTGFTAHL